MARKVKRRKPKPSAAAVKLAPAQLRMPGEVSQYWVAVTFVTWACIGLAVAGEFSTRWQYWQWAYLALWPIGSIMIVNYVANRDRVKQLKELGPSARVFGANHPELSHQLKDVADLLGIRKLPVMYLVEDEAPYIYAMAGGKGAIILTTAMVSLLRYDELSVMIARELAHLKFGHVRLERALYWMRNAPALVRVGLLPLLMWSTVMGEWLDLIEYTADRAAVLVAGGPGLVTATIVKVAAAADPTGAVKVQDIEDYLAEGRSKEFDSVNMERQFKLNRFVESIPNLRDRIEQIGEFYESEEGKQLLEQVDEVRARLGSGG
jgi:Zn-dependent protease with chaperone function